MTFFITPRECDYPSSCVSCRSQLKPRLAESESYECASCGSQVLRRQESKVAAAKIVECLQCGQLCGGGKFCSRRCFQAFVKYDPNYDAVEAIRRVPCPVITRDDLLRLANEEGIIEDDRICGCPPCPLDVDVLFGGLGLRKKWEDVRFKGTQCKWHQEMVCERGKRVKYLIYAVTDTEMQICVKGRFKTVVLTDRTTWSDFFAKVAALCGKYSLPIVSMSDEDVVIQFGIEDVEPVRRFAKAIGSPRSVK